MRETFRIHGRRRFTTLLALAAVIFLTLVSSVPGGIVLKKGEPPSQTSWPVWLFLLVSAIHFSLELFVRRVIATDRGFTIFNEFNRITAKLDYSDITWYKSNEVGMWQAFLGEKAHKFGDIDYAKLHRVIRHRAPKALAVKRWRSGQMPPPEDFKDICPFDPRNFVVDIVATFIIGIPVFFLAALQGVLMVFAIGFIPSLYDLRGLFFRVSITKEGISDQSFGKPTTIGWNEITAVFCNGPLHNRTFTIVTETKSITLSRPIAQDLEVMRKFFYTLPDGTPCVNFDENIRRGYRNRRKRRIGAGSRVAEPSFGSF